MIKELRKIFIQTYLKTIKYGHLTIVTLLGIWPCYYDHNTNSYKSTWYLRFYSITILASIGALFINTSITLYDDISKAHPSDTGSMVAVMLSSSVVLAVVVIYLIQIRNAEQINGVVEDGKALFQQICNPVVDWCNYHPVIDWSDFLIKFTIYIIFNGSLCCYMTISRLDFLSPKANIDFSLIFFYSLPNCILSVLMSIFFCGLSILEKYFCILNQQLTIIANDKTFDPFHMEKPYPNYRRMQQCCLLSDKIDYISTLHFKLCKLTRDFCDVFAMQFLVCHSFTVMLWIFKLFLDFLIIRNCIVNKQFYRLPNLVWIAGLNIATSIVDLSGVAGVCSKMKSEFQVTENLTHKMSHCPCIDSRFMKSIEGLSIQLTQFKLKLSPYGLYDIDYTLVFSIVSAAFSYLIILMQFELANANTRKTN